MILSKDKEGKQGTIPCTAKSNNNTHLQLCADYVSMAQSKGESITVGGKYYPGSRAYFDLEYLKVGDYETRS